jgi:glycosyltransferase involved in cell wall biosynthesis
MIHVTYVGNFLSQHGLNPTYSEALVPQLAARSFSIRAASRYLNPVLRMSDMIVAVLSTPKENACVILDLCSGPRALPAADLISRICRISRRTYIVVLHGGSLPATLTNSKPRLLNILTGAKRVISPSRYLAEAFADYVDVEIIPNALRIEDYPFRLRKLPQPNFLYLRALHRDYGSLNAIRAFSFVQQKYPDAHLTMVGPEMDGGLRECESLAAELGLDSHVEFIGRVPKSKVPEFGNKCDIFLNPTFVDNTPVSTVEAMAMGMCIVATTAGGLPYLLRDGETALLVTPGNDEEMAAAMLKILENPSLSERLSQNARSAAEEMDWRAITPRWVDIIQSVA